MNSAGCSIESALLQHGTLIRGLLLNLEAVAEIFLVQDTLGILSKLVAQQCPLLVAMLGAHVSSLVDIRGCTSIECPVILVEFILLSDFSAVEAGLISTEVGIFSHGCVDAVAARHSLAGLLVAILNGAHLFHLGIVEVVDIEECLVGLRELTSIRGLLGIDLPVLQCSRLIHGLVCGTLSFKSVESSVIASELSRVRCFLRCRFRGATTGSCGASHSVQPAASGESFALTHGASSASHAWLRLDYVHFKLIFKIISPPLSVTNHNTWGFGVSG